MGMVFPRRHSSPYSHCFLSKLLASRLLRISPLDSLKEALESDRAYETHPEAIKVLLDHGYYNSGSILGSQDIYPCNSQICLAIEYNRPEAPALFLDQGVQINAKIGELLNCDGIHFQEVKLCFG